MRKGSTELGSLGANLRRSLTAAGIALLMVPISVAVGSAVPARAQEEPMTSDSSAREALERRSGSWMDHLNKLASRKRLVAIKRRVSPKKAQAQHRVMKVIHTRATWYGPGFHGRRTASGERFNQNAMTLASRHLPFGTRVRITNKKTGKSAIGRVNDRGPFRGGYTADLSKGLAFKIGMRGSGPVKMEILGKH
jgi:rare lipoprotein A